MSGPTGNIILQFGDKDQGMGRMKMNEWKE